MPIIETAALVITALTPYLVKGGEKFVEKSVEEGFEQRGKIWQIAKGLFTEDELTLLNLFEENPEDAKIQGKLEGKLEDRLKQNPDIAKQLEELLEQIPNLQNKQNTINQSGNDNIAVQDINESFVRINRK